MRRSLASEVAEAGKYPTIPPASLAVSRNPRSLMWAAASLGRRRSPLWVQFWPGSCSGFMLQPHETFVARSSARIAVRGFDCAGDDLHAGRKGRHQDLFRPANSRRSSHRSATGAGILGARLIGDFEPAQTQLPDNFRYQSCAVTPENDSTFTNPDMVPIAVVTNPSVRPFDTVVMTVDGRAVGRPGTMSYTMTAPLDRGTHTRRR